MKTIITKFRYIILFISFLSLSSLSIAQDVKIDSGDLEILRKQARAADSLVMQASSLEKQLADSSKMISNLTKELNKLKLELSRQNEKKGKIIKPYEDSIASLLKLISAKDTLITQIQNKNKELSQVQNKLNALEAFKNLYIDNIKKKEEPYLLLAYSKMDQVHLKEVIMECNELNDPELVKLSALFKDALQRKNMYDEYVKSINCEYDSLKLDLLLQQKAELTQQGNALQNEEVLRAVEVMESYKDCLTEFKSLVMFIKGYLDKNARTQGINFNLAFDNVKYILGSDRVLYLHKKFSSVPYLVELFDKYQKALIDSPTQTPQIEKEILNK